jgi:hypothetical protein
LKKQVLLSTLFFSNPVKFRLVQALTAPKKTNHDYIYKQYQFIMSVEQFRDRAGWLPAWLEGGLITLI